MSRVLIVSLVLVLAACESSPAHHTGATSAPVVVTMSAETVDLRFQPLHWAPGDRMEVSDGTIRLTSLAARNGSHRVQVDSERHVLQVTGLLDGTAVTGFTPDRSGTFAAGSTGDGPTSIHKETVCAGGRCVDVIEYDYDLTTPDGDGSTLWQPDEEETASRIDRLQIRVKQTQGPARRLEISTPSELRTVR